MEKENKTQPTQEERYHKETHCESCGRFVGVYTRCPYCQALTQKRLSIRIFKGIAVLTSTIGLLLLLFYARHIKTPEVKIADLGPLSNFAHIRVEGIVDKSYGIHKKWKSLGFVIAQGEGENRKTIQISAYSKVAKAIEAKGLVPNKGDRVVVEGQVRFRKDTPSLLINAVEHLAVKRSKKAQAIQGPAKEIAPQDVNHDLLGMKVKVTGSVTKSFTNKWGVSVMLDNGDKGLQVWIPNTYVPENLELNTGDLVEATGRVETYKKQLQIKIHNHAKFNIVSKVQAPTENQGGE